MKKILTIKDCKCKFIKNKFKVCKFHKECIDDFCASGINMCNNPRHIR